VDAVEVRRYFKNGQLGDSLWIVISEKKETTIGIEKSYFENGKLSEITYFMLNFS
jgi:antitoxin component YwqK of YwqJK toxin-antitoxin module